jgi:streptogramin lyase
MKSSRKPPRPQVEQLEDRCVPAVTIKEFPTPTTDTGLGGIAAGPDGNLWFTEQSGNDPGVTSHIGVINPTTHAVTEFALPTPTSSPGDIVAGPDGNLWFTEELNNKIGVIDPTTHAITEYAVPTPNSDPRAITVGPDGNLWFTETTGNNIGEINPSTGAITEYPIPTPNSEPFGITAGPDGNLWFTEDLGSQIGVIDPTTHVITQYATPTPSSHVRGITAGPDGNLWFTDFPPGGPGEIGEINPSTGAITEHPLPAPSSGAEHITAGPDGNLWFTDFGSNKIGQINPTTGAVTEYAIPTPTSQPQQITAGPDGNLWFTEATRNLIGQVVLPKNPTVTWNTPADIPYGTPLGTAAQLDATASVPGTFQYTPAAGTVLNAGANQPLSVTFTPTDTADFNTVTAATTINVVKATPTFTGLASDPVVVGTASATLSGTLSAPTAIPAGDTVTVTAGGASATATVQADGTFAASLPTAALAVGSYTINYQYAGSANFNGASGSGTLQVANGVAVLPGSGQAVPSGGTLAVEVELTNAAGANISSAAVPLHADYLVAAADPTQAHLPVQAPGNSQPGNFFKFHGGRYHFDLKTTGLAPGIYELFFSAAGDPVEHAVSFTVITVT